MSPPDLTSPAAPVLLITKEFHIPPDSGATLRTDAIARVLAAGGATVVVCPDAVHVLPDGAGYETITVHRPRRAVADALRDLLTLPKYQTVGGVLQSGSALLGNLRIALRRFDRFRACVIDHTNIARLARHLPETVGPILVSMHNVESDLVRQRARKVPHAQRPLWRAEVALLRRMERIVARDLPVVVTTEADRRLLAPHGPRRIVVCTNGIWPEQITVAPISRPDRLLFLAALDWKPNVDGLRWLLLSPAWRRLVSDVPGIELVVAGRNPSAGVAELCRNASNVSLVPNPETVRTLMREATVGIVPLLEGGGSRIKILEYVAGGLRVVSTAVGASGLVDLPPGVVAITGQDTGSFVAAIRRQLRDDGQAASFRVDDFVRGYAWPSALRELRELVDTGWPVTHP
ncbi:glycosyltransferase family 4 protein [Micromonospora sp. NPDC049101]|uniref:glycosyltransferase family 4 protein n=1 Tax=unclassified Micromonospora TaxID=2617518 RepID=UPI0033F30778